LLQESKCGQKSGDKIAVAFFLFSKKVVRSSHMTGLPLKQLEAVQEGQFTAWSRRPSFL
jgi:hypothetical protein